MKKHELPIEKVKFIAELGMMKLTDEELQRYKEQIESILSYAEKLSEVDTSSTALKSHVSWVNRFKGDDVYPSLTQDAATKNRKETAVQGYILLKSGVQQDESAA